jgi:hypothetical protein
LELVLLGELVICVLLATLDSLEPAVRPVVAIQLEVQASAVTRHLDSVTVNSMLKALSVIDVYPAIHHCKIVTLLGAVHLLRNKGHPPW